MVRRVKKIELGIAGSIREIVFGLEDGLVSTLGALTGIAAGTGSTFVVILSGVVLVIVEALSMGAGSYLSEKSAHEVMLAKTKNNKHLRDELEPFFPNVHAKAGLIMWASYTLGGIVPLAPYFFLPIWQAIVPSVILTVIVLFLVGVWKSHFTKRSWAKSGVEMVVVSLSAAFIGFLVGRLVSSFFGIEL